jgi:hypothetical protein
LISIPKCERQEQTAREALFAGQIRQHGDDHGQESDDGQGKHELKRAHRSLVLSCRPLQRKEQRRIGGDSVLG